MKKDEPLFNRLVLIGSGLIGSSIARAARAQGAARAIVATARSAATRRRVAELGIADQVVETNAAAVQGADMAVINMEPGQVMLEFVGQMVDVPTTTTTFPGSNQFGFLSFIRGLKAIFMTDSPPFDRTTAKFGFVTRATTTREIANGPLVVITREGVTRISFTPCPWCLSPSVGIINPSLSIPVFLIQTSTLRQQVIIDNETRSFSIVNINTITETRPFNLGGTQFQLGQVGQVFRTSLTGQLDPVRLTEGHFAGHAVGVANSNVVPLLQ